MSACAAIDVRLYLSCIFMLHKPGFLKKNRKACGVGIGQKNVKVVSEKSGIWRMKIAQIPCFTKSIVGRMIF